MIKNIARLLWDKWRYSVFHWISNKLSTLLHGAVVDIYPKYLLLDVASQPLESSMSKANILLEQERGYCSRSDHRRSGGGRVRDGFQAAQTTVLRKKNKKIRHHQHPHKCVWALCKISCKGAWTDMSQGAAHSSSFSAENRQCSSASAGKSLCSAPSPRHQLQRIK